MIEYRIGERDNVSVESHDSRSIGCLLLLAEEEKTSLVHEEDTTSQGKHEQHDQEDGQQQHTHWNITFIIISSTMICLVLFSILLIVPIVHDRRITSYFCWSNIQITTTYYTYHTNL